MKRVIISILVVLVAFTGMSVLSVFQGVASAETILPRCCDGYCDEQEQADPTLCPADCHIPGKIPHYFIAVHNEPDIRAMDENFRALKALVGKANEYNMKLTLMFTPQWVRFIESDPKKTAHFERWISQGHEIAGHHHSIWHGGIWDGFTYLPEGLALRIRHMMGKYEPYLGDLDDYTFVLSRLNPNIHSGCMNDEYDKRVMPDSIVYDTCSGFANFGRPGRRIGDAFAVKGINMYISVGYVNGIERKWLTHAQVTNYEKERRAERVFGLMNKGVYGAVTHSIKPEVEAMMEFMEFLHRLDPAGAKSITVSEAIDSGLLPEIELPAHKTEVSEGD